MNDAELVRRIQVTMQSMVVMGPLPLVASLCQSAVGVSGVTEAEMPRALNLMLSDDMNSAASISFGRALRGWDNEERPDWGDGTARNTAVRRTRIYEHLDCNSELKDRIAKVFPYFPVDEPVIVAKEHVPWYPPQDDKGYYWSQYLEYMEEVRGWRGSALLSLTNSTRAIVECLADPASEASYSARGLVMGYVQSGKTANFTGVIARAADAGYRMIIVLAGTWNILRNQTQRRLDKELLGKEFLRNDETYMNHPPRDWNEFLTHGFDPIERGNFNWERMTRPEIDFRRLKAAIESLEMQRPDLALPLYHRDNLRRLPVKLLVIKKHSQIIANLVDDLKLLRTRLVDLPTLIIDDESDQAGINTVNPKKNKTAEKERTATNKEIVRLLGLLPRAQYVGYTATPYANALVPMDDEADLFPRDFILSLDRPDGYMGVADFFDTDVDYEDLDENDYSQPEVAFLRRVESTADDDDEDLTKALRSYVLSGAVKLFRAEQAPGQYSAGHFRHHTMLIHTSSATKKHKSLAERILTLWDECAFNSPRGRSELEALWRVDHQRVCAAQGRGEVCPGSFDDLVPYIGEVLTRVHGGGGCIRIVNSENARAPDFSEDAVWKIIIGGNKLSRGYTIEGLTTSYYRRNTSTGDTLMQMGRWFGFRPGYRDLVRVYIGVREGKKQNADLVASFKSVCKMEEAFREEIKRYVRNPGAHPVTPRDIPPLIAVMGGLPPTAKNKMHYAQVVRRNFSGEWAMPALLPKKAPGIRANLRAAETLLGSCRALGQVVQSGGSPNSKSVTLDAFAFVAPTAGIATFLEQLNWLETDFDAGERPVDIALQGEFLRKESHGIEKWLILAPQRKASFGPAWLSTGGVEFTVKHRSRIAERRFGVIGEPKHRAVAESFVGLAGAPRTSGLVAHDGFYLDRLEGGVRGVMLLYPIRDAEDEEVSIGIELLYPENGLDRSVGLCVVEASS